MFMPGSGKHGPAYLHGIMEVNTKGERNLMLLLSMIETIISCFLWKIVSAEKFGNSVGYK